jgi:hypothetical protein
MPRRPTRRPAPGPDTFIFGSSLLACPRAAPAWYTASSTAVSPNRDAAFSTRERAASAFSVESRGHGNGSTSRKSAESAEISEKRQERQPLQHAVQQIAKSGRIGKNGGIAHRLRSGPQPTSPMRRRVSAACARTLRTAIPRPQKAARMAMGAVRRATHSTNCGKNGNARCPQREIRHGLQATIRSLHRNVRKSAESAGFSESRRDRQSSPTSSRSACDNRQEWQHSSRRPARHPAETATCGVVLESRFSVASRPRSARHDRT